MVFSDPKAFLNGSDYIIHGGDIGDPKILEELALLAPVIAVRGNNDKGIWAGLLPVNDFLKVGEVFIYVLHDLAELEKSLIQERTKAGRAAAVARGVKMGRKVKLTPQQVTHARKLIEQGEHHDKVAKSLGVSRRTLYRVLKE